MTDNELKTLTEVDQRSKSNTHQINEMKAKFEKLEEKTDDIHTIATSIQLISQDMNYMKKGQEDLSKKVDGLSDKMDTQIDEIKCTQTNLSNKVTAVENKPALETAANVSKVKVAIYSSVATFLVLGIIGAIVFFR